MTSAQVAKLKKIDAAARAEHLAAMRKLDPQINPNIPGVVKILDANARDFL